MERPTRMLAGLLRCLAGLLGEQRRAWVHALLAETGGQPTPSALGALRGHLRYPPAAARPDGLPERA